MEALHQSETAGRLPKDAQDRLDQFKAFAARHPLLDQVEQEVLHAIWEPAGCAYLLVYGPSGVGKSTMIHHIVRRLNALEEGTGTRPLLLLEVRPPDGKLFHRTDYYRTALRLLGKTAFERRMMVDISTEPAWEKKGGRRHASRYHDDPELRYALEDTLRTQQVRAVVLDEAQHLMQGGKAATPLDQLDWLKSMTNVTGVLHVLLGTYSLVHFCNLNGQTARRGLEIHFPRYHGHGSCTSSVRVIPAAQKPVKRLPSTICVRGRCHGIHPRFLPARADRRGVGVPDALWAVAIGAYDSSPADIHAADASPHTLQRAQTLEGHPFQHVL